MSLVDDAPVVAGEPFLTPRLENAGAYPIWRAWYMLIVLELVALGGGAEGGIISLLVRPIEAAFRMNDVGLAAVAFVPITLGGALVRYPSGLFADTFRRRDIIAAGCVLWALAAVLTARADSTTVLFWARLLAGAGLGMTGPAMFSIITDAFPSTRRAFAFSVSFAASAIGGGLALALFEWIIQSTERHGTVQIWGMLLAPWQQCFVAVAAIGFVVFALVLTVSEPARLERAKQVQSSNVVSSIILFGKYLRRHGVLWLVMWAATAFIGISYGGALTWLPEFGARHFRATGVAAIGLLGTTGVVAALVGSILGGFITQRAVNSTRPHALTRLYVIMPAIACVSMASFPYMPSWSFAVWDVAIASAAVMAVQVLLSIGLQEVVPNESRGQLVGAIGLLEFIPNAIGPVLVASLAAGAFVHFGGLGPAMAVTGGIAGLLAIVMFAIAGKTFERARDEVRALAAATAIETV